MSALTPQKKRAWVTLLVSSSKLTRLIDQKMVAAGMLSMEQYDILLMLEDAAEQRMKMSELADAVLLSRSGVTRLVDRLEKLGLVTRGSCPSDRRTVFAMPTEKGLKARAESWNVYQAGLEEYFAPKLSDGQAETVAEILSLLVDKKSLRYA